MNNTNPRLVIGATSSGSGKTTITCGILCSLINRGLKVASFKCGPDYIDPMFHEEVLETPSNNLDSFFLDKESLIRVFNENAKEDISIIEGVMGYYDGITSTSFSSSTYEIASILKANTILIVNCKGMSQSIIALIKGFVEYVSDSRIKGIILNNISKKVYDELKPKIEELFNEIVVLGYVPKLDSSLLLESRHLGLVTAKEILDIKDKIKRLSDVLEETIDFDKLLKIASIEKLESKSLNINKIKDVRIGIARDKAFCFYYDSNIDLLKKLGAEIVYFSPLCDKSLPPNLDGLYFGGGYPELYLEKLSNNTKILNDIKQKITSGIPVIAECGGFMYLNKAIDGYKMVGVFDSEVKNMNKLVRFGYVTLTANENNLLLKPGEEIKGHEFHYYDSSDNGSSFSLRKTNGTIYQSVKASNNMYAGFPHLYFYSNINFAINFINKCWEWKNK